MKEFKTLMSARRLVGTAVLSALMGMAGVANAALLSIIDAGTGGVPAHPEVIGDPGGTSYPWINQAPGGGPGLPTVLGGWPVDPNMAPDPTFGGNLGIQGAHAAFLVLDAPADVTFQFMGSGNAVSDNSFQVFTGGVWQPLFSNLGADATNPCGAAGAIPVITCTPGVNQFTFNFGAGFVAFRYITGAGVTLTNGVNNPDTALGTDPGFFLGADPYLVGGTGNQFARLPAVFAGLTDLPALGDHDFQDLGVLISVPEPGTIALFGVGLLAVAFTFGFRRRMPGSMQGIAAA